MKKLAKKNLLEQSEKEKQMLVEVKEQGGGEIEGGQIQFGPPLFHRTMRMVNEPSLPRRHRRKSSIVEQKEAEMKQAEDKKDVQMKEESRSEEELKV